MASCCSSLYCEPLCCVVVVVDVVTHVSSVQVSYTARCCSLCSLAAVATSPSMNVYSSVTVVDFSASVSSRSEWRCRCILLAPVRVIIYCPRIFFEKTTDIHDTPQLEQSDCDP